MDELDTKISDISPDTIQKGKETIDDIIAKYGRKPVDEIFQETKNYNKHICFSNIRELLKNSEVKLGQIERDAGCQPGYMSRLEKEGNTSEPTVNFIVTAARLLSVSIDTLVSVDLTELTPTEQYILSFLEKLQRDTLADKLDWNIEKADSLNRMEPDYDGDVSHPLFSYETFMEQSDCEYPNEVSRVVFTSDSYGPNTYIRNDCFSLRIKNGSIIYLMDISKSVFHTTDSNAFAKEIWIYTPGTGSHLLAKNNDGTLLTEQVDSVFETVKTRMKHPQIKKDHKSALDAFMNDDLTDDTDTDDLPF